MKKHEADQSKHLQQLVDVAARTRDFRLISPANKEAAKKKNKYFVPTTIQLNQSWMQQSRGPSAKTLQLPKSCQFMDLRRVPSFWHSTTLQPPAWNRHWPFASVTIQWKKLNFFQTTLTLHPNNRSAHINIFVGRTQTYDDSFSNQKTFPRANTPAIDMCAPNIFKSLAFHRIRTWPIDNERHSTTACPFIPAAPEIEASTSFYRPPRYHHKLSKL